MPHKGTQPIQTAKAAPAKPISERVWAKNENPLATTYTPTIPQVIAIMMHSEPLSQTQLRELHSNLVRF